MADITVLSGAVRYLNGSGQYVSFDAIKGDTGPQGNPGVGETISVSPGSLAASGWTAGTWSAGAVAAGETSGGTCYYRSLSVQGATSSARFVPTLVTGNATPIYATPGTDTLLLETKYQPTGAITFEGTVILG